MAGRGGELRAAFLALLAIALPVTGLPASAEDAQTFLGFRLLDLENQSVKWHTPTFGQGATVTYAFARRTVSTAGARNCGTMLPPKAALEPSGISELQFRREVEAAFRMWEKVAAISFRETEDADAAGILIGAQAQPVGRAFTNVALKPTEGTNAGKTIGRSLICLNPRQPWKVGFDGRLGVYDLRYTLAHEIGHAIGLDHPSASGQLMSYRYDETHSELQAGDIRGASMLYGPPAAAPELAARAADGSEPPTVVDSTVGRDWPFGIGDKRITTGSVPAAKPAAP